MVFLNFILSTTYTYGSNVNPPIGYSICNNYDTAIVFDGSYDLKLAIATEMLETVDWNEETQAKARQYLYDLLIQDTTLANSNTAFLDFIAEYESWLQSVYEVSEALRNIEHYDSLFTSLIRETDSLIQFYTDSINYIYEHELEEEYAETLEWLYYQVNFLEQTKSNLISQRQALVEGELGEIQNDYVVSPELPAQNTQTINGIYIDFIEAGDNVEVFINNYSVLLTIANQCPAAGGQSVYRARAMLALINDSLEYNDHIVCLQSGIYRETNIEIKSLIRVFPNPASNEIEVIFDNDLNGICKLTILNPLGQEILIKKLDCSRKKSVLDVSMFDNGIYIIKIKLNNESFVHKLIITK